MNALDVEQLGFAYGARRALDGVTFGVAAGLIRARGLDRDAEGGRQSLRPCGAVEAEQAPSVHEGEAVCAHGGHCAGRMVKTGLTLFAKLTQD